MSKFSVRLFAAALAVAGSTVAFGGAAQANPVPIPAGECPSGWLCLYNGISFSYPLPEISRSNHCVPVSQRSYSIINNSNRTYYAYATSACGGRVATIYPYTANNYTTVAFSSVDTVIHT